jgi:adenylate kinase family enzyme
MNKPVKKLILIRGLPGSSKTTKALEILSENPDFVHFEADMFFISRETGEYKFDATQLKYAHNWCQDVVETWMENSEERIVVSNTFTQEWEMKAYYELAEKYGYRVHSIIVENRHGGVNEHGVPDDKLEVMKSRFEIKL